MKQEIGSGSGISWATCKSALSSRQITTPVPHHSVRVPNISLNVIFVPVTFNAAVVGLLQLFVLCVFSSYSLCASGYYVKGLQAFFQSRHHDAKLVVLFCITFFI